MEWDYVEYEPLSVDEYEIHHALRRPLLKMYLPPLKRQEMLQAIGYDAKDLHKAKQQVDLVRKQRFWTQEIMHSPLMYNVDGGLRSLARKVKRALGTKRM